MYDTVLLRQILLPPLNIKLELMKDFLKGMDINVETGETFK